MKKNLFCCFFALCIPALSFSQKGLELGLFAQPQFPYILNNDYFNAGAERDYMFNFGMAYGGTVGYGFTPSHGIRTGAYISQQGQKYTTTGAYQLAPNAQYSTELQYLQIPLLYRYTGKMDRGRSAFQLTAGIQYGLLQSIRETYPGVVNTLPLTDIYKSSDLSGVLGLGVTIRLIDHLYLNSLFQLSYSLGSIEHPLPGITGTTKAPSYNAVAGIQIGLSYVLFEN